VSLRARRSNQFDRLAVEAGEHRSAEPAPFVSDDAVGKIAARFKDGESGLDRWAVQVCWYRQ
jgi:hypothetical protein